MKKKHSNYISSISFENYDKSPKKKIIRVYYS